MQAAEAQLAAIRASHTQDPRSQPAHTAPAVHWRRWRWASRHGDDLSPGMLSSRCLRASRRCWYGERSSPVASLKQSRSQNSCGGAPLNKEHRTRSIKEGCKEGESKEEPIRICSAGEHL
jgi:hypothetical protein